MTRVIRHVFLFSATAAAGLLLQSPAMGATQAEITSSVAPSENQTGDLPQAQALPTTSDQLSTSDAAAPVSPIFSAQGGALPDLMIAGFAEVGLAISDKEAGSGSTFFSGSFNPALYARYGNLLLVESELEISATEDGDTETVLEFAQLDLLLHKNMVLVVGKFLSPVGQFTERLHPVWINRLPNAPAGFGHDGLQPGSEVGVQARGGITVGRSRMTYAFAVGNGPRLMEDGALMQEGSGGDDNNNKAISGRIGFLPVPYVDLGASFQTAKVRPMLMAEGVGEVMTRPSSTTAAAAESIGKGPNTRFKLWGVDGSYKRGSWDVRAEFLRGIRSAYALPPEMEGEKSMMVPKMKLRAWYGQVAYRLSGITQHRILQNFELAVRYGEYNVRGNPELAEENNEKRWDVGLNYWFGPAFVLHAAIERRRFTAREADRKDTRFLINLGYGF